MTTRFTWNELLTGDVDGAKEFLSATFGWSFEEFPLPDGPYWVARSGEDLVGGVCHFDSGSLSTREAIWLAFVEVEDVDDCVDRARSSGASVLQEPHDVPNVGRVAVLRDPTGAAIGVLSAVGTVPNE